MNKDITNLWKVNAKFVYATDNDVNCDVCSDSMHEVALDYKNNGSIGAKRHFYAICGFGTYCSECRDATRAYSKRLWIDKQKKEAVAQGQQRYN